MEKITMFFIVLISFVLISMYFLGKKVIDILD